MKIQPPGGPTNISSIEGSSGDEFDPQAFLTQFSKDMGTVSSSLNQTIATINSGGSEDSIKSAYNQLMSLVQDIPYGQGDPLLDGDLRELRLYGVNTPDDLNISLNELHCIAQEKIDFSDKSNLLFVLNGFRDNLLNFNSGIKNFVLSVDDSPINTSLTKSVVDQDFTNYQSMLQDYIDGNIASDDMPKFLNSLGAAFSAISNDMSTLSKSLDPVQASVLNDNPFSFDNINQLNTSFCTSARSPSMTDACSLMTNILALQKEVDSFNF